MSEKEQENSRDFHSPKSRTIETGTNLETKDTAKKGNKSYKSRPSEISLEEKNSIGEYSGRELRQSKTQTNM
jgi:hypothetical protein